MFSVVSSFFYTEGKGPVFSSMRTLHISCFLALSSFALMAPAFAHKADYIDDTLVFETLGAGEAEPEYFLDIGRRTREDASKPSFQRHTFATEYGITDHWMADARAAFDADAGTALGIENFHVESRYRFFDEGTLPIDIALSAELFWEAADAGGEDVYGVAPRLILSKDLGETNLTLNLTEATPSLRLRSARATRYRSAYGWEASSNTRPNRTKGP